MEKKTEWEAIKRDWCAGASARVLAKEHGISHTSINNRARAEGWAKVSTEVSTPQKRHTVNPSGNPEKTRHRKASGEVFTDGKSGKLPETKPEPAARKADTRHPPFQPGNQHALKHGGYARRLLLPDDVTEDAQALTLEDELLRVRGANLVAAANIGRWTAQLDDADDEQREILLTNIDRAESAMNRNTGRIESLSRTISALTIEAVMPAKILADIANKDASTEKTQVETANLRRASEQGGADRFLAPVIKLVNSPDAD
ncbi:hypothetical protein ACEV6Q_26875 [Enterobacter ludwigii]|uniref:hypothetical protein n=1 Tax=Enterobacter ludwigii TaxID=299767 RepID=UPI003BEEFB05